MAIKKAALYSSLWASCDELRGGMDASQYKDYVLTMLFIKYVSDKYKNDPYGMIVIPEGASFDDLVALKGDKEIGDKINKLIIGKIAEENDLKGVIDVADFNDEDKLGKGKEMVDRLTKLVGIFEGMDLSDNRADGDDLLGDAYEYLMRHFATESGKSKGQFYTPSEVSRILAKVVGIKPDMPRSTTVYDPTCGSGSLLLKASDEAKNGLSVYGQEMDVTTSALAKMNMILHGHVSDVKSIAQGNTIASPAFKDANKQLKTFDFAVANPPFSNKNWTSGIVPKEDLYARFEWGIPPEKNGDYTFLLHIIKSLKSTGKGAVILPHGVLFRGNAEANIRENLIKQGYIRGIIGLPANLFYGTGIPACIIVIDKENCHARKGIFMVDASKGFMKDGNKNRLRSQDIHKVVDVFTNQLVLPRYSRMVPLSEIAENEYNLNIPRYIDSSEPEDLHDLSAHLKGGIPNADIDALERFWKVLPSIRQTLFEDDRPGYSRALVEASKVKTTILEHAEFSAFAERSMLPFASWVEEVALKETQQGDNPKELIFEISEALLEKYADAELLSRYDVYQILMDYWADVMQDDVYVLVQDNWTAGKVLRELVAKKGEKLKETPDLIIGKTKYKAELIPPALIVARYFADKQANVDALRSKLDAATQALETYIEENSGDEGLLNDALNDKDKVTKATVTARLKVTIDKEEIAVLKQTKKLFDAETSAKKKLKEAQEELDSATAKQYAKLTIDDVKSLVVDDKWNAALQAGIQAEIERATQQLANRVQELEARYAEPLPKLTQSVEDLSDKVAGHLKAMELEWSL
ncbi:TPA: type I restriction-modification system subunit M [Vibrio parahaemolyticus]|uniref:type I restriction-modification system subunit M n=1 Tax=Vibrio parahaemolyticus TaxID=670 RepID=UPI0002E18983|nr:type I restriction-modification system subunit M [Vibrio parahaemolyticus]EJA7341150.1 type I restriction-modification system subunit M [Vibrio parahaemolyticus]MBY3747968.1 type I restriction-modification system subunit M [Vibrio parahaemolyticus]MBY3760119.1 type I restriction-modification system subunit M [Vibrio parahaemolyticus]MBY3765629.1 type I restriction-modification system subunit M [Vibrio parahaemolyticus]MBY3776396.1 type I restriction-modification system subunit M [Vibrio par